MVEDNTPKVAPATPEDEQEVPTHPTPGVDTTGEEAKGNVADGNIEDESKGKASKRAKQQ